MASVTAPVVEGDTPRPEAGSLRGSSEGALHVGLAQAPCDLQLLAPEGHAAALQARHQQLSLKRAWTERGTCPLSGTDGRGRERAPSPCGTPTALEKGFCSFS